MLAIFFVPTTAYINNDNACIFVCSVGSRVSARGSPLSCWGHAKWAHLCTSVCKAVCERERVPIFALFWFECPSSRGLAITEQQLSSSEAEMQKSECSNRFFFCLFISVWWLQLCRNFASSFVSSFIFIKNKPRVPCLFNHVPSTPPQRQICW